jgi:hypothetical protein
VLHRPCLLGHEGAPRPKQVLQGFRDSASEVSSSLNQELMDQEWPVFVQDLGLVGGPAVEARTAALAKSASEGSQSSPTVLFCCGLSAAQACQA